MSSFVILGTIPTYAKDSSTTGCAVTVTGSALFSNYCSSLTTVSSQENPIKISYNNIAQSIDGNYNEIKSSINNSNGEVWYECSIFTMKKALTLISKQGNITATVYQLNDDLSLTQILQETFGPNKNTTYKLFPDQYSSGKVCYIKLSTDSATDLSYEMFAGEPPYIASSITYYANKYATLRKNATRSSTISFDLSTKSSIPTDSVVTKITCLGDTDGIGTESQRTLLHLLILLEQNIYIYPKLLHILVMLVTLMMTPKSH